MAPGAPETVREVMASPSGSEAVTLRVSRLFSLPLALDGALTTGARSLFAIVILVVVDPESAFDAVKVTL